MPALQRSSNVVLSLALAAGTSALAAQAPSSKGTAGGDPAALVKQAAELNNQGKQDQAMAMYQQVLLVAPQNLDAHLGMGIVLDLEGRYDDARKHITEAISLASTDSARTRPLRTMAVSYAFTRDATSAAKYEQQVIDAAAARQDYTTVADVSNELARIYLESGDANEAYKWYESGHENALRKPNITQAERDLWDFRWEHAQARIAARRGQSAEAVQHVKAAKAILDKGDNPTQAPFYPYLTGYVALYAGQYSTAITDLQLGDKTDPFINCLIAQAYEKSGDRAHAMDYYRKVLTSNNHNPPNAFARPLAKEKLAAA
jgi:tetratricopeptide (TPR) repeat protein